LAEYFAELFKGIPPQIVVLIIGALPVVELRGAIPWALAATGLSWQEAILWSLLGNFIPIIPILLLLEPVSNLLRRSKFFDRFFNWIFERTRKKGKAVIEKYQAVGLAIFVGIPLPGTGVWTGAAAAFVFGIKFKYAFPAVFIGMLMAGVLVTLASMGVIGFLKILI